MGGAGCGVRDSFYWHPLRHTARLTLPETRHTH